MALPWLTTTVLQRRAFLLRTPAALAVLASGVTWSASPSGTAFAPGTNAAHGTTTPDSITALNGTASSREQLSRDCGFIVDVANTRIDLGVLPAA